MFDLEAVQQALVSLNIDAWLLCDFRGSNPLAQQVLQLPPGAMGSRRWAYCIPARGMPRKLVHRIEADMLDHLPGESIVYLRWQEYEAGLAELVGSAQRLATEYSPGNANPYISRLDAGTMDLVRATGAEPVSSGDLIQSFEAVWSERQWELHQAAAKVTDAAFDVAWQVIAEGTRTGAVEEVEVRDAIMQHFANHGLVTYHPPIVARGPNSGLPHYETGTGRDTQIRQGDFVLVDLWAKVDDPDGVYSDLTRTAFVGKEVPSQVAEVFAIVAKGRDAAIERVREAFSSGTPLRGWEVDEAARRVIEEAGFGEFFTHRTGHNIGREVHGNGAHMDGLETREERLVLPRTCFSIEPGIYLPEFGIRSEVNVFIDADRKVHVTGGELQREVIRIG